MKKYIVISYMTDAENPTCIGIFGTHQGANVAMQQEYDESLSDAGEDANGDDSDASHFVIEFADGKQDFWIIDGEVKGNRITGR